MQRSGMRVRSFRRHGAPDCAPLHPGYTIAHSITSSARASSVGGNSRLSARAVLRLSVRTKLVGCSMGRSAGFAPLGDTVDIIGCSSKRGREVRSVRHQPAGIRIDLVGEHGGQALLQRQCCDMRPVFREKTTVQDEHHLCAALGERAKRRHEIVGTVLELQWLQSPAQGGSRMLGGGKRLAGNLVPKHTQSALAGKCLSQQPDLFFHQFGTANIKACDVAARPRDARRDTSGDGIEIGRDDDDRQRAGRVHHRFQSDLIFHDEYIDVVPDQFLRRLVEAIGAARSADKFDDEILSLDVAELTQALLESRPLRAGSRVQRHCADAQELGLLLRARSERRKQGPPPPRRRAARRIRGVASTGSLDHLVRSHQARSPARRGRAPSQFSG